MRTENGQNGSKRGHIGKNSGPVQMRSRRTLIIMDLIFYQKVQVWPFLRMRQLGKKSRSENMVHLRQVHIQKRIYRIT